MVADLVSASSNDFSVAYHLVCSEKSEIVKIEVHWGSRCRPYSLNLMSFSGE